jgi:hypothetical protein
LEGAGLADAEPVLGGLVVLGELEYDGGDGRCLDQLFHGDGEATSSAPVGATGTGRDVCTPVTAAAQSVAHQGACESLP